MSKILEKAHDVFQEAYLWIWDRTGVYLATVLIVTYLSSMFAETHGFGPVKIFMMAVTLAWHGVMWWLQSQNQYDAMNSAARGVRDSRFFRMGIWVIVLIIMMDAVRRNAWDVSSNVLFLLWAVGLGTQIREREPPERWFAAPETAR
jgi:cobalamin synthase